MPSTLTEEPEELCSIVKAIVERSSPSHLNQLDNRQRTPLHLAAAQRLPQIVRILVEEEKTDVLKTDDAARTALHYACQNGLWFLLKVVLTSLFVSKGQRGMHLQGGALLKSHILSFIEQGAIQKDMSVWTFSSGESSLRKWMWLSTCFKWKMLTDTLHLCMHVLTVPHQLWRST